MEGYRVRQGWGRGGKRMKGRAEAKSEGSEGKGRVKVKDRE